MNTNIKSKYKYSVHLKKLILAQFGAAMLAIMTSMPTITLADGKYGTLLGIATTLLAIVFYLYLQYTAIWDIAAKDKLAIDSNRMEKDDLRGLKAALFANIPTYVLAVLSIILKALYLIAEAEWIGLGSDIFYAVELLWNYMYHGFLVLLVPASNTSWLSVLFLAAFIILTVPSLITCLIAYRMGLAGKRILPEKKKNN